MHIASSIPSAWKMWRAIEQRRRSVRVLIHRAYFMTAGMPAGEHFFMKVTNTSASREIEITHIWFETTPRVQLMNDARPLPTRLRLDEMFETWISVAAMPDEPDIEWLGRVELTSGRVIKSKLNTTVQPYGYVAGPGSPTNF